MENVNERTPSYLREKLPANRRAVIHLPNVFQVIKCRTDRYSKSFFPDAILTWNRIISNFDDLPSYDVLKSHITSLIRPIMKPVFNIHNPSHLRYLFQLRVGLSQLRFHKKCHNFADTPSQICLCNNGVEDTSHFLFHCSIFADQRSTLTSSVDNILRKNNLDIIKSVDLYLYGHPSLSITDNHDIILSTLAYIKCTNRFAS